jgi:adenosylmethionine-8-amino-7-oxononanoate aminotransferase
MTYPACALACADDLERQILQAGPETIAAFIAEPITISAIVGHAPPTEYFQRIRAICDEYDLLFVADCVQTGFGRTGTDFAISQWGVSPDILIFDKGITGGYFPLGGMIVSDKITEVLVSEFQGRFHHGQSYTGNPLSAAVGLKVLEIIRKEGLTVRARERGRYLLQRLQALRDQHPTMGEVRGRGLIVGVEFVRDRDTRERFPREVGYARKLMKAARDRGVLVSAPTGNSAFGESDQLRLTPPLIISEQELDVVVESIDQAVTEVESQLLAGNS